MGEEWRERRERGGRVSACTRGCLGERACVFVRVCKGARVCLCVYVCVCVLQKVVEHLVAELRLVLHPLALLDRGRGRDGGRGRRRERGREREGGELMR